MLQLQIVTETVPGENSVIGYARTLTINDSSLSNETVSSYEIDSQTGVPAGRNYSLNRLKELRGSLMNYTPSGGTVSSYDINSQTETAAPAFYEFSNVFIEATEVLKISMSFVK